MQVQLHASMYNYIWHLLYHWIIAVIIGLSMSFSWNYRDHHYGICWAWDGSKLRLGWKSQAPGDSSRTGWGLRSWFGPTSEFGWRWFLAIMGQKQSAGGREACISWLSQIPGTLRTFQWLSFNSSTLETEVQRVWRRMSPECGRLGSAQSFSIRVAVSHPPAEQWVDHRRLRKAAGASWNEFEKYYHS